MTPPEEADDTSDEEDATKEIESAHEGDRRRWEQ
jgi:hypothetical protein